MQRTRAKLWAQVTKNLQERLSKADSRMNETIAVTKVVLVIENMRGRGVIWGIDSDIYQDSLS